MVFEDLWLLDDLNSPISSRLCVLAVNSQPPTLHSSNPQGSTGVKLLRGSEVDTKAQEGKRRW